MDKSASHSKPNKDGHYSSKPFIEQDRSGLYGLHIAGLTNELNENDLRDIFKTSGYIQVCKIVRTNDKPPVAFVKFCSLVEAQTGLKKCNGVKIGNAVLDIRPAYESQRFRHYPRYHKDKSSSSESLSKQDCRSKGSSDDMASIQQHDNHEQIDDREVLSQGSSSPDRTKGRQQSPSTYVFPPASQDIRFSNGSQSNNTENITDPNMHATMFPPGSQDIRFSNGSHSNNTENTTDPKMHVTMLPPASQDIRFINGSLSNNTAENIADPKMRTTMLPPASQGIRFANGCQSNSIDAEKPLSPSSFNTLPASKGGKDGQKHTDDASSFVGLQGNEVSRNDGHIDHKSCSSSNKQRNSSVNNVAHVTKNLKDTKIDDERPPLKQKPRASIKTNHKSKLGHQSSNSYSYQQNEKLQQARNEHINSDSFHHTSSHAYPQMPNMNVGQTKYDSLQGKSSQDQRWSVEDVISFYQGQVECSQTMIDFIKEQEIDGNALMLIEESSLLHFMKLGPALKFLNLREKLKN